MIQPIRTFVTAKPRLAAAFLVGILVLPLLAHVYNGSFTRMMADDYCFANVALEKGIWGALDYWYNNWTGTPSSTIAQSLIAVLGPRGNALAPAFLLVAWFAALFWTTYQLARLIKLPQSRLFAFLGASLILYGVIVGIPNVYQAMYWTSGAMVYTAPLILVTLTAGVMFYSLRQNSPRFPFWTGMVCAALTFIIGGFTQTIAALQISLLIGALVGCWKSAPDLKQGRLLFLLFAALVGAMLALVVTLIAPGNAVRQAAHPINQSLLEVAFLSLENAAAFIAMQLALFSTVPVLVCLMLAGIVAYTLQAPLVKPPLRFNVALKWIGLSSAIGFILIVAFLAPAAYGMGKMLAARAWIVPQTILILVVISWGVAIGLSLKKRTASPAISTRIAIIVALLSLVGPVFATLNTMQVSDELRAFASEWDERDRAIRTAVANGNSDVSITPFSVDMADFANLDVVDKTTTGDYTVCMQRYYGLQSVKILAQANDSAE